MSYYVYILKSAKYNKHYIGSTENLEKRINYHNSSRARYTKRYQPWVLLHFEEYETRSEAMKREKEMKNYKNVQKLLDELKNK